TLRHHPRADPTNPGTGVGGNAREDCEAGSRVQTVGCSFSRLVMRLLNSYTLVAPSLASGEARRGSIPPSRAVTEEQRSQKPNWPTPEGRPVLWAHTSLFAPYRSLRICSSLTPRLSPKSIAANV